MENTQNFPTLESYVTWRNDQRIIYKDLSSKIRLVKNEIRQTMKDGNYAGNLQCSLVYMKQEANAIMEQRRQAKAIAIDSWSTWKKFDTIAVAA